MNYKNVLEGQFICRPNRFIAEVMIQGKRSVCHVKNTGRLKELLTEGAKVFLEQSENPNRKTAYDLIAVEKEGRIINIDSQAPNQIAAEWLPKNGLFPADTLYRREVPYKNSRFDLCAGNTWIEVKGITLNDNGIARFPDAPTLRGVKHLNELTEIAQQGGEAMLLFVVQMKGIHAVAPNDQTHPEFGAALRRAAQNGVRIYAVDCITTPDSIVADQILPVLL
jgi:sugar fermentation stimulation protein A